MPLSVCFQPSPLPTPLTSQVGVDDSDTTVPDQPVQTADESTDLLPLCSNHRSMKIVNVQGGLGNQLFQYAFGKYLSARHTDDVYYDFSWFEEGAEYDHDILYLDSFETEYDAIGATDRFSVIPMGEKGEWLAREFYYKSPYIMQKALNYYREVREGNEKFVFPRGPYMFNYCPAVVNTPGDAYFRGYWQSYEYVDRVWDRIEDDFALRDSLSEYSETISGRIESSNSVSVHVRRGDYVRRGWELSETYYKNAIDHMRERVRNPQFFVFSDDIPWAKETLNADDVMFVEGNDYQTCYEDMYLMSRCDRNIIANSTFSWWGAWLNDTTETEVIAPRVWVDGVGTDRIDVLPPAWETIADADG
jgi:hypothetical protein